MRIFSPLSKHKTQISRCFTSSFLQQKVAATDIQSLIRLRAKALGGVMRCTRNLEGSIISCSKDISSVQVKGSLMYFQLRYLLDTQFLTSFLSYDALESHTAMFLEYFDAAGRLGNLAGSTSEIKASTSLSEERKTTAEERKQVEEEENNNNMRAVIWSTLERRMNTAMYDTSSEITVTQMAHDSWRDIAQTLSAWRNKEDYTFEKKEDKFAFDLSKSTVSPCPSSDEPPSASALFVTSQKSSTLMPYILMTTAAITLHPDLSQESGQLN
ncbi:unnamed protein product [Scomber scombrus]|uniref:Unnamed protein product n=1 Tax=Scomber scombrus TaxID=13677 RepID=A0AAV1PV87_SCOSC